MLQSNEPTVGSLKTMYVCDPMTDPLANTKGIGVTWDFSNLISSNSTKSISIIDASTSSNSSSYPGATKAFNIQGAITNFFSSTATKRLSYGFVFETSSMGQIIATFDSDKQHIVSYPFAYGNNLIDAFSGSLKFSLNGLPQNSTCTGNSYATIDGQGTLLLPSGNTFSDVIRYKIVDTVFTQIYFPSQIDFIVVREQYEYYDLSNDVLPIFMFTYFDMKQVGSGLTVASQSAILSAIQPTNTATATNLSSTEFKLAPNPTEDWFSLELKGSIPAKLSISDLSGRVVKTVESFSNGQTVSVVDLPKGTYLVTLDQSIQSEKLVVH
jgi:hypothetical protein